MFHHAQVVRDEKVGEVLFLAERVEQQQNLGLNRDVERGYRFIQHHELGIEGDRARDAHTLFLAAGELMWIVVAVLALEAHFLKQRDGLLPADGRRIIGVDDEDFFDRLADGLARIEARGRVLKDDLHVAAQRPHLLPRELAQVYAPLVVVVQFGLICRVQTALCNGEHMLAPIFEGFFPVSL